MRKDKVVAHAPPVLAPLAEIGHTCRMGKVIVKMKLTNQGDLVAVHRKLSEAPPRTVEAEALVDTGATRLYLKPSVIHALGLEKVDEVVSQTTNGLKRRSVYEPVRLDVQGRYGNFDVVDIGENVPNLLGQIPLEYLDFVVDAKNRKLIPNPEHGEKQMSEEYSITMNAAPKYIRREPADVKPWTETCGLIRPLIAEADGAAAEVHLLEITDATLHYHERTDEIYYIIGGQGRMALDETEVELRAGVVVYVPRGVKHRAWGDLKVLVVCIPRGVLNDVHEV